MSDAPPGRFVVLHHLCPADDERPTHYDVMLEHAGALLTWAVAEPPMSGKEQSAERLADHRLAYLDFEGELTGNRGSVRRWDAGTCQIERVAEDEVWANIKGVKLKGRMTARRSRDAWSIFVQ